MFYANIYSAPPAVGDRRHHEAVRPVHHGAPARAPGCAVVFRGRAPGPVAIIAANTDAAADTITFTSVAALAGTVSPASALPTITKPLTINGAIAVSPVTGSDKFRIDGASAGASTDGLRTTFSASLLTVQNLIITRFSGSGIELDAGGSVSGSIIGTDASGTPGLGNSGGGGIKNSGTLTVTNSTVSGNTTASGSGGGIHNSSGSTMTLTNSTVSGNAASGSGGGIYATSGTVTLTNSTVSGNTAALSGGGISIGNGTLTIANSTITNNTADSDGNGVGDGGGIASLGTVNLKNTIAAGNSDPSGGPDCFGALTSQGYNLIQTVSPGCTIGGVTIGNVTGQGANLGPLALNAPGTTQTHAVLAGSPAIDAGRPGLPAARHRPAGRDPPPEQRL